MHPSGGPTPSSTSPGSTPDNYAKRRADVAGLTEGGQPNPVGRFGPLNESPSFQPRRNSDSNTGAESTQGMVVARMRVPALSACY
jgi:hypothetical protein